MATSLRPSCSLFAIVWDMVAAVLETRRRSRCDPSAAAKSSASNVVVNSPEMSNCCELGRLHTKYPSMNATRSAAGAEIVANAQLVRLTVYRALPSTITAAVPFSSTETGPTAVPIGPAVPVTWPEASMRRT